ncbi:uncharacterized protein Incenp isoform X1 [Temnothorax longispinosus]|uniref:Inner centromere protein ARK-binding domain-containing protein n=1 Tax=Temnothorax longispinosus TaxID=300112 RepID=A0A4S2JR09_9HYME|nr:Uncharacterized protein DBV15_00416 [Temnothorax longispinosus]
MNARSKSEIRETVLNDLMVIHNRRVELSNRLRENLEDSLSYVRELAAQLSQPSSGPLVPKTPKIRKKAVQRIETIPEDEVFQQEHLSPASSVQSVNEEERKENEVVGRRAKRGASKRAADNIKKQSLILSNSVKKMKRDSQIKRKKSAASSSDEDNDRIFKYSRVEESQTRRVTRKQSKQIAQPVESTEPVEEAKGKNTKEDDNFESPVLRRSSRASSNTASFKSSQNREVNNVDDTIVAPNADDADEPSMYEDAIGKPVPVMNSTLKHSLLPQLNATVVLERLPQQPNLNETVVIQKAARNSKKSKEKESSKKTSQDVAQSYKAPAQYNDCDELITDDESSPETKKLRKQLGRKKVNKKQVKVMSSTSSDDEIPNTPVKTRVKDAVAPVAAQESKTTYKSNALFSPYAKESVKKRVEAFEQAVMYSPKSKVDVDAPTRITRTKTRAMATAEMETETNEKSVAQKLARKSVAKAKRISLAKQKKNEELKEVKESVNKEQLPERINKLLQIQTDKINVKQTQQLKTTPLSKLKLMQPTLSVNRLHTPLNTQNLSNYSKTLTASRANIITNVESLISLPKSTTKTNSAENQLDEKKRPEEDARKKREEALRLQTEEKRRKRQEKELKNKLAREAKEKQELEKRQRAEREREEKAKLALAMQEKQREEMERKRLAQLQRAQEKEERRKLEEQQKLQRLQEQEEAERSLAEQRRREQEAEKRREAEARAQQAAAEALRSQQKTQQLLAAQAKHKQQANNKHQGATVSYVLDSEPDDDESDDESRPKHEIPHWAQAHVRKAQLAMQLHIPDTIVYKFFNTRKCTPDLTELFHGIDRSRLKRTSSAIWKTPPRISMMETEFLEPKLS